MMARSANAGLPNKHRVEPRANAARLLVERLMKFRVDECFFDRAAFRVDRGRRSVVDDHGKHAHHAPSEIRSRHHTKPGAGFWAAPRRVATGSSRAVALAVALVIQPASPGGSGEKSSG